MLLEVYRIGTWDKWEHQWTKYRQACPRHCKWTHQLVHRLPLVCLHHRHQWSLDLASTIHHLVSVPIRSRQWKGLESSKSLFCRIYCFRRKKTEDSLSQMPRYAKSFYFHFHLTVVQRNWFACGNFIQTVSRKSIPIDFLTAVKQSIREVWNRRYPSSVMLFYYCEFEITTYWNKLTN